AHPHQSWLPGGDPLSRIPCPVETCDCRGCELPLLRQRAEQAEATLQRVHAFAASIQEPGAPLFWPEMGRRIQQELNDHGAGSGRCPSCDHPVSLHQPDGCWFAVTEGTVGRDLVCPCSVPRTALDQPEEDRRAASPAPWRRATGPCPVPASSAARARPTSPAPSTPSPA